MSQIMNRESRGREAQSTAGFWVDKLNLVHVKKGFLRDVKLHGG